MKHGISSATKYINNVMYTTDCVDSDVIPARIVHCIEACSKAVHQPYEKIGRYPHFLTNFQARLTFLVKLKSLFSVECSAIYNYVALYIYIGLHSHQQAIYATNKLAGQI